MFIEYKNITTERTVDVRTEKEFKEMSLFKYNVPIINEEEHKLVKKIYPMAFFIIYKGLCKRKKQIRKALLDISENGKYKLVIGCSRGRLRSPVMYFYAKSLGIDCKVLSRGIKRKFEVKPEKLIDRLCTYFNFD